MLNRQLISAGIWILGAILGPLVLTSVLEGNPIPILTLGVGIFLFLIIFVMKDRAIALPVIGISMGGRLNFLPFGLDVFSVLSLGLIVYYFFTYFTLKQRNLVTGPRCLFIPILVITVIVLYHTRNIGLYSLMASSEEGSRPGIRMLLGVLTYFCAISITSPSRQFLARLPIYCIILGFLFTLPNILSTFFPNLAPYLYYFSDSVNVDAYKEAKGFTTDVSRNAAFAGWGSVLELFLVCYYPIYTWWRPHRWWVPILFLVSLGLIAIGGFRGNVIFFGTVFMLAMLCYFSWRSLFVLPFILVCFYALSLCIESGLVPVPLAAQRSLSFLPGKWDPVAMESANGSLDFRANIEKVYWRENLYKSPLIGTGFTFNRAEFNKYTDLSQTSETPDHYYQAKAFITGKMYHTGWISLYDTLGLIGSIAFVAMLGVLIGMSFYFVWGNNDHDAQLFPLKLWLFCCIGSQAFGFFTVFGDVRSCFVLMIAFAIILVHLYRLELGWGEKLVVPPVREREDILPVEKADVAPSYLQS